MQRACDLWETNGEGITRAVQENLAGLLCLDDVILIGKMFDDYITSLEEVFKKFKEANQKLKSLLEEVQLF